MSLIPVVAVVALIAGAVPWALYASHRFGHRLGVAAVLLVELLAVLFTLVVTGALGIDPQAGVITVLALIALSGVVVCVRSRPPRPDRVAILTWAPALLGGVIWLVVIALSAVVPGASSIAWVMNGDGFNNLFFAGVVTADHGVALGPGSNPVPFPAALIALAGMPADGGFVGGAALEAHLGVLAAAWSATTVLWCVVSGAAVAAFLPRDRPRSIAVASAFGSLLPLTAFVGGLSIQWGTFNVSIAIPLVLLAWLVQFDSDRHPVASLAASGAALTLLLATWSPLAALAVPPVALVAWRERKKLATLRGSRPAILLVALIQLGFWIAVQSVPSLAGQEAAFLITGIGFPSTWPLMAALLVVVPALALQDRRRLGVVGTGAVVALAMGAVIAMAFTLFLGRGAEDPLAGYYPTKLAWLLTVAFGTLALAVTVGKLARLRLRRVALASVAAACVAVLALATVVVPGGAARLEDRQVFAKVLGARMWHGGERSVDAVLALSDPSGPGLLWSSGDPDEGLIDFWVLVTHGAQLGQDPRLRMLALTAYRAQRDEGVWQGTDVEELCEIVAQVPELTVYSDDPHLEGALADACATEVPVRPTSEQWPEETPSGVAGSGSRNVPGEL